jgi:hypothetical protein
MALCIVRGRLVGRQYSIVTDQPVFRGFQIVMEGNNEVDIDGQQRRLDYLGTEDGLSRHFAATSGRTRY